MYVFLSVSFYYHCLFFLSHTQRLTYSGRLLSRSSEFLIPDLPFRANQNTAHGVTSSPLVLINAHPCSVSLSLPISSSLPPLFLSTMFFTFGRLHSLDPSSSSVHFHLFFFCLPFLIFSHVVTHMYHTRLSHLISLIQMIHNMPAPLNQSFPPSFSSALLLSFLDLNPPSFLSLSLHSYGHSIFISEESRRLFYSLILFLNFRLLIFYFHPSLPPSLQLSPSHLAVLPC